MSIGILGTKIGMTQIFDENGLAVPVTVVQSGPCIVTQIKNFSTDGYNAIQIGFLAKKIKNTNKAEQGHFTKVGCQPQRILKEFKVESTENFTLGQQIKVDCFEIGQFVNVTGRSIGKGFSGLQKRYNFSRGPMTHGSKNHRLPGSIGAGTTPGRVLPGKKMAGQYGNKNVTISKLKVLNIDSKENLLLLKGAIPGKAGNIVSIAPSLN
uniref:Large ribosomal subunit protein uL3c n=3 Tax=Heterosigma akashiwo TaxID=2829 RepID=B2XTF5_HETAK|nr:ribosomal protein L3 [Heterosigma akashiwo]ABV66053.1 50S ribosomal protein L3 [Heterosigma akashiwo]ABV70194.1 50S ribosomal protein L3 [Heterosigma akashiwo]